MSERHPLYLTVTLHQGGMNLARRSAELWFPEYLEEFEDGSIAGVFPEGFLDEETQREKFIGFVANMPGVADRVSAWIDENGLRRQDIGPIRIEVVVHERTRDAEPDPYGSAVRLRERLT